MTVDTTRLNFYNGYPIDKVVYTNTIIVVNDGNTTTTGTNDQSQAAKIVTSTIANPYGRACFVRYKWAINGTNFNSGMAHLLFSFTKTITSIPSTSSPQKGLQAAVSVGASDSTVYFRTANGLHGNVVVVNPADNDGYTPTSQTFTIKYALFERD